MGRAPCCDKANVKKGPWSPEEDAKLKSYIEQNGTGGNWIALPQKIGLKRCGKSCRLRWLNYLRPNIKHGSFSEEEDNIICSLYVSIGSRWSIIAAQLPGRTDNDIKNYWNTRLKKKLLGNQRKQHQHQHQHPPPPQTQPTPYYSNWPPSSSSSSSSNSSSASDNCVPMPPLVAGASIHDYDYNTLHHQYSSHDTQQQLYPETINNSTVTATTSLPSNNNMYDLQQGFENLTDDDLSHLMACVVNNQEQQMGMQQGGYYGMEMASGTTTGWGAPPPLLSVSDYELAGGHACRQSIISHYQHDDAAVAFHQEPAASRYFGMQML